MKTIDIHVHTFNLAYFPIKGILVDRINAEFNKTLAIDSNAINLLEKILLYKIKSEQQKIEHSDIKKKLLNDTQQVINSIIEQYLMNVKVDREQILKAYNELFIEDTHIIEIENRQLLNKIINTIPTNLKRWFLFMMNPQSTIIEVLESVYPNMIYVNHHMDTVPTYKGSAFLSFDEQLERTTKHTNGKSFINFVGFNPLNENSANQVITALGNGFKGVKYYPPLGYNPIDPRFSTQHETLFKYCNRNKVPIFIHTTKAGFGPYPGENANPTNWISTLEKYRNINICFGHAGGNPGWFTDQSIENNSNFLNSYAYNVINICNKYQNAYCEIGFLHHIFEHNVKNGLIMFLKNLNLQLKSKKFKESIMYGSDWHTLLNETINGVSFDKEYHRKFEDIMNNFNVDIKEHFFYKNAVNFLGL